LAALRAAGSVESGWVQPLVATVAASGDRQDITAALAAVLPGSGETPTAADFGALGALLEVIEREGGQLNDYLAGTGDVRQRVEKTLAAAEKAAVNARGEQGAQIAAVKLLASGGDS